MPERKGGKKEIIITGNVLIFGEGLFGTVMSGVESLTIRLYRPEAHDFKEGDMITGRFKDGYDVQLRAKKATVKKPFSEVTDEEARQEGSANAVASFENLKAFYPGLKPSDIAGLIGIEVVQINGKPIVKLNEYFKKD